MKVVNNGSLVGRVLTCFECKCEFEIESDDTPDDVQDFDTGLYAVFECPQCRNPCTVRISS